MFIVISGWFNAIKHWREKSSGRCGGLELGSCAQKVDTFWLILATVLNVSYVADGYLGERTADILLLDKSPRRGREDRPEPGNFAHGAMLTMLTS